MGHTVRMLLLTSTEWQILHSLPTVFQYLTLYRLLVRCHYLYCCILQSVRCLSVPHNVLSFGSVSLCLLMSCTVCSMSVSTSQCTVCFVLCHYVHYCLLESVQCLSVRHNLPSVGSVSLCPLLPSTVCPWSVSTS